MGPDRKELFSFREVCTVVEQVLFRAFNLAIVASEEVDFGKRKFPVNMRNALPFQSMAVRA
jgi:hypothetical protein